MSEKAEEVNELFEAMIAADAALDAVIRDLVAVGIKVDQEQRMVVAKWLDSFEANTRLPISVRLAALRGMLRASCAR